MGANSSPMSLDRAMSFSHARLEGLIRRSSMAVNRRNHHYIVLSQLHRWMESIAYEYVMGDLLDYGCGAQPYRSLFAPNCKRYICADVAAAHGVKLDILIEPGRPLPVEGESFDTILSTQTLEHVMDFNAYVHECFRLLRPGGCLILTVPMQWRLHEQPFDYWRFTRYGVSELLNREGFEILNLTACGGAWSLVGQIINSHLCETGRGNPAFYWLINGLALAADQYFPDQDETIGWMCVAERP